MGYLKGKSSLMIYEQFGNLKYKYKGRKFWCRGYYGHAFAEPRIPWVAVRQHAGAEAGLNVLRSLGGLLRRCDLPLDVVQREHPLLPIMNEAHVRGHAAEKAAFNVLGALVALVGDDVYRFQSQVFFGTFRRSRRSVPGRWDCL